MRELRERARRGGDGSLVHDVRVALRRLEATGRLFRGFPEAKDGDALRIAARDLRRRLSSLRSEEVGRTLLAERAGDEGLLRTVFPDELPALRVDPAEIARLAKGVTDWRRRLAAALGGPFAPRSKAGRELRRRAGRRLRRRLERLAALLPPTSRTLHRARIAAKRLRYALELLEALEPRAAPLLDRLRPFQDAAGEAHDLLELAVRLRTAGPAADDPRLGHLGRELQEEARRAVARARRRGAALRTALRRLETR
ncbi:MAG TPA: CHAD domain-containing protein [Thermoanaerobaculia bacterium]|nr:CHAD domain-containing protein [Thermoanaerobaculia bacterium]HPA51376.1 CHAD domain-containing protein [Thermoanaerobaculia bacterium]HQN07630.1 CHAD domain-containing protein [Thermoanaerobaculia bacterium]HQP84656.1 CHAD domain-containing protein [Thermoanaerobaculia bacterium]